MKPQIFLIIFFVVSTWIKTFLNPGVFWGVEGEWFMLTTDSKIFYSFLLYSTEVVKTLTLKFFVRVQVVVIILCPSSRTSYFSVWVILPPTFTLFRVWSCSVASPSFVSHGANHNNEPQCAGSDSICFFPCVALPLQSKHSSSILPHQQEHLESTLFFTLGAMLNGLSFLRGVLNKSTDRSAHGASSWEEICPASSRLHVVLLLYSLPFVSMPLTIVTWPEKKKQHKECHENHCVFQSENIENVIHWKIRCTPKTNCFVTASHEMAVPAIAHKHSRAVIHKLQHKDSSQGCSATPHNNCLYENYRTKWLPIVLLMGCWETSTVRSV